MPMRASDFALLLFFLAVCCATDDAAAAPAIAACPAQLTAKTPLPAGARVLGQVAETLTLWEAELSFGEPGGVGEDRALSSMEQDEDKALAGKRHLYRYDVQPGKTDIPGEFERFLLACSYGTSAKLAAGKGAGSAMLLVPLPYKARARCDVIHDASRPGNLKQPLISASCEAVK
jgi:hypothetical protein